MSDKQIKNKIYGKLMNSAARTATLDGIMLGFEIAEFELSDDVSRFVNDLYEVINDSYGNADAEYKNLNLYAEQFPWNK
jgi:hypothetical protein